MSYCSDVALILNLDVVGQFEQFIEQDEELRNFIDCCKQRLTSTNGSKLYYWRYISWQLSYRPIEIIEIFMDQLDEESLSIKYLFIRMGESWNDVEYRGEYGDLYGENPFRLEFIRDIRFPGMA
ncbi:hypothetical protein [Allocoleopsis franciscana]|uniref:Uncharacterized protein n=1 Tax=Allocoleopsis franciscana PCC 7113 TaxID=1173027 RepID=K9WE39_9CYAN|nr:hypothetical protein [Allocoleopsis franciscana]AFZ18029.1 hypothetical protein Mic7113_2215 [Allocoleopsis franciscana PCC 7113]